MPADTVAAHGTALRWLGARRRTAACLLISVLAHLLAILSLPRPTLPLTSDAALARAPVSVRLVPAVSPPRPEATLVPPPTTSPPSTHTPPAATAAPTTQVAPGSARPAQTATSPSTETPAPLRRNAPTTAPLPAATRPLAETPPPSSPLRPITPGAPRIDLDAARALARESPGIPDARPAMRNLAPAQAPVARDRVEAAIARATAAPTQVEQRTVDGAWLIETGGLRCRVTPGTRPPALEGTPYATQCSTVQR
ncbi:MAG: hypothetical protein ACK4KV_11060 [Rhodocyclaceae bacterium]